MLHSVYLRATLPACLAAYYIALIPRAGLADTADTCAVAYEGAQRHRQEDRLLLARAELNTCVVACPLELREDCSRWSAELVREIPSLKVSARDSLRAPLADVSGLVVATKLPLPTDGSSVELDPGPHTLRFVRRNTVIERVFELARGQRDVVVEVVFPLDEPSPQPLPPPRSAATHAEDSAGRGAFPNALEVVGLALGAAALGLGVAGHLRAANLRGSCAPSCSEASVNVVRGLWWAAAGTGVVAAASFGVGYARRF